MHIFLTGGTGFLGSHFISSALSSNHHVIALRRPGSRPRIELKTEPQWLDGSLSDNHSEHLSGCDALVHLAAYGVVHGSHDWDRCFQTNLIDSLHLLRNAAAIGVRRIVVVGSCFEYGRSGERYEQIPPSAPLEPTTAYGASKAALSITSLALAVEEELELVVARPFHLYGEGQDLPCFWPSLVTAALSGHDFPMTTGEQVRDYQPVEMAAKQLMACLQSQLIKPGLPVVVNLGTGEPRSLLCFAKQEWSRLNASGKLKPGQVPQRPHEVMRYVPELTEEIFSDVT